MILQNAALAHTILQKSFQNASNTDIGYEMQKHVTNRVPQKWRGGRDDFHMETPMGSPDNREVARLSPDELTASSYFDRCRREIPQLPPPSSAQF